MNTLHYKLTLATPATKLSTESMSEKTIFWCPAYSEFRLGDTPSDLNRSLSKSPSTVDWNILPVAIEYKEDEVRYFLVYLRKFPDPAKFVPPGSYVSPSSYACFLFTNGKLFRISISLIHDHRASNYKDVTKAYARAVHTPVLSDGTFNYEDDRIFYYSSFQSDHTVIETIAKGCVRPDGTFWNPFPNLHRLQKIVSRSPSSNLYDITISYCHHDKEICYKLYKRLMQNGFRVWITFENVCDESTARMAEAVENSDIVLICMSEAYRLNSSCHFEAERIFKSRRCYIPLIMQKNFKAIGWLGILIGLRTLIDFAKYSFDSAYEKLITEIGQYSKQHQVNL